ncbi:uncharacterized protein Dmoj_GI14314 [Drosophila mojavensis]|uniref:Voltage-dependent calcium channel gamma-5 subunit n=1 Tax=Drosophila mojavensis TaxID=7230 RepID=B4L8Q1_DROMO|nr:uncharacterized protein Dmoj_GI14314 [Drosophila mojavensis]
MQPQQSPYATLPRGQQIQHESQKHLHTGVINTISGSIPATGFQSLAGSFSDLQLNNLSRNNNICSTSSSNNNDKRQQQLLLHHQEQQQQQHPPHQQRQVPCKPAEQQWASLSPEDTGTALEAQPGFTSMSSARGGYLWLLTPVAASISVAIVIAALAGPQWLFTEEKLPNVNYNGTANFNALDDGAYVTKYTKSSLWILCTTLPGLEMDSFNCIKIDYFPDEDYQPDPHDSTSAIPYTVTRSCPIFLGAGILLVISFLMFMIPTCTHRKYIYYFSSGILFIVSGLIMLIGLIAYISILKAEIGSKLRSRSTLQPALFKVSYGQSFFLFVFGFIATEFVGVLNIFLFINMHEMSYYSRLPCFSLTNIHSTTKEDEEYNVLSHSYKRYHQPNTATATAAGQETMPVAVRESQYRAGQQQQQVRPVAQRSSNARLHQVHDARRGPSQTQTLPAGYACLKHPNANGGDSNQNLYLHNDLERRFYFEKPAVSKCNLHSRSFAKSLNELCLEPLARPAPAAAPAPAPPPPPTTTMFADLPQEFPLTRSVSTTTDIYTVPTAVQLKRKQLRNMATNTRTDQRDDEEEQTAQLCGLKRGLRKTKDELFQEFCKRAGMRAKPKNIYYIPSEDPDDALPLQEPQPQRRGYEESQKSHHKMHDEDDADGDDHGFRQFRSGPTLDEEHLYIVGDHAQLVIPRRVSMCVEPMLPAQQLRKLNSNMSLHMPQTEVWPWMAQPRLASEHGQSRTLPRCFLRQTAGSQDSLGSLQSSYSASQLRFSQLMQQHQQQLDQQNRYLSTLTLPRAVDEAQIKPQSQKQQQPLPQPQAQPPPQSAVQWPSAIPSSPSNYANGYPMPQPLYAPAIAVPVSSSIDGSHPPKFQRAYAFDDAQRRASQASCAASEAFDLDEMERERRRSHASLFGGPGMPQTREQYDLINGTAV